MWKRALTPLPHGYNIRKGGEAKQQGGTNYTSREKVCFVAVFQQVSSIFVPDPVIVTSCQGSLLKRVGEGLPHVVSVSHSGEAEV